MWWHGVGVCVCVCVWGGGGLKHSFFTELPLLVGPVPFYEWRTVLDRNLATVK